MTLQLQVADDRADKVALLSISDTVDDDPSVCAVEGPDLRRLRDRPALGPACRLVWGRCACRAAGLSQTQVDQII